MGNQLAARSLVVLLFDTLRADSAWGRLSSFSRLIRLTQPLTDLVCGSFPTVPMRTDLLTGTLSFLYRRWATPQRGEEILTSSLRSAGVKSVLVTDNYVLTAPQLGADFTPLFDEAIVIHGNGADPFLPVDPSVAALSSRPSRSHAFDLQYLTNAATWRGGSPTARLLAAAAQELESLAEDERYCLWVDCFSPHEPWIAPSDEIDADEPFWPPYGSASSFTTAQVQRMRNRYEARIAMLDTALTPLVDVLEARFACGDLALLLLSDHGFYFGDFGLIGKPKDAPVLPPLYDLVHRASPHFAGVLPPSSLQPHDLTAAMAKVLGADWCMRHRGGGVRLIGRHSDVTQTLTLLTDDAVGIAFHDALDKAPVWCSRDRLRTDEPWQSQFEPGARRAAIPAELFATPWLGQFRNLAGI